MSATDFLREPSADAYEEHIITVIERGLEMAGLEDVGIKMIELHRADMDALCDSIRERARQPLWNPANCGGFLFRGIPVEVNPTCQRGSVYLRTWLAPPTGSR